MRRRRSTRSVPGMSADTSSRQQVAVGDVVLRYDEQGSGDPPLLLLHGFTGAALDFVDVIPALAASRRVVAYDQRGHGDSTNTGDAATYTFDQLTEDLAGFVDARLSPSPFDLLGHSMGGIISLRYVLAYPERVRSLVLMDTGAAPAGKLGDVFGPLAELGRQQGMAAVFATVRQFWVQQAEAAGLAAPDEMMQRVESKFTRMDPEAFGALADALGEYPSMVERLGEIGCPTTVLVGENDTGLRASADVLAEGIAGAELVVIPDAGHSPQEDQPQLWTEAVLRHLARV
jgi:pimeloyl-ACP methyl ester carboxylesterase